MKSDLRGLHALGRDGVLRSFDAERNIIDARVLTQAQVREYYADVPAELTPDWVLTVDGLDVSEWDMYHPAPEDISKKATEEDRAAARRHSNELRRREFLVVIPKTLGAHDCLLSGMAF
ncbi:hypothetical protein Micbo1qcDRAFT_170037 [Microdochium bolleyi]|uniref:Uncharacterized protein n=1 Tax=Microdochium bolleyi TaxID=196109 RepID=A0A136IIL3_9PEZI|nr:hypothetical protein Micbo1qcDRAFT_170037 [Microdochium bolleyi]